MHTTDTTRAIQGTALIELLVDEARTSAERARHPTPTRPPIPIPIPLIFGSRFLIWKQDPSVLELGRRLVYIAGLVMDGPRDTRVNTMLPGTTPLARGTNGDFIFNVPDSPEADCAHTFAVVRETLTMYERFRGGTPVPWVWNGPTNTDPVTAYPRAGVTANAFYSRSQKALKFFYFTKPGTSEVIYTCRSLDVVSHETGHAVLDGLKPGWISVNNPPQTGALHEAFGDLSALFLALAQLDQVDAVIAITRANLHARNFLAALAEQFGSALGSSIGLRSADNDLKLSQVSNEVHALSQVFTGGIYDALADIFAFERNQQRASKDPARVLLEVGEHVAKLLLAGIDSAPATGATFADVVNGMLQASANQNDPPIYRTFLRNRFTLREVVVSPTPLTAMTMGEIPEDPNFTDGGDVVQLETAMKDHPSLKARQDRSLCCGTMQLPEYYQGKKAQESQLKELRDTGEPIDPVRVLGEDVQRLKKEFAAL